MVKGKLVMARRKVVIKRIKDEKARQVCFSKRRQGLFKKASELSNLCGAMVGSVVFARSGKPYSFGHPSINDVADRFLNSVTLGGPASGGASHDNSGAVTDAVQKLNVELLELQESLDYENKKTERLQEVIEKDMVGERRIQWWNANVLELGIAELQEFQKFLEEVNGAIKEREKEILDEARKMTRGSVPASSSRYQIGQNISADSMASTGPSSINNPMLTGGLEDVCGLWNFRNNQNHG